jgi:radical SAM superfamily enzyme YgiQ (UPF0313 family)
MYTQPQKRFSIKPPEEVLREIEWAGQRYHGIRRVFLADGDATALSTRRLLDILHAIRTHLPQVTRVASYCSPRNIVGKSDEDLKKLYAAGLKLVYVGAESGDDMVLRCIDKGETRQQTITALNRLADTGIRRSIMIINGLAGARFSEQHAIHSAQLANESQPDYLATLVINLPHGDARFQRGFDGQYESLSQKGLFAELHQFMQALELKSSLFRSDHASNQLVLKGVLNKDKDKLLAQIQHAINQPEHADLRPVWIRPF